MPPSVEDRLRDVLEAIQDIEAMLADMSLEQFSADNIRRMATELGHHSQSFTALESICGSSDPLSRKMTRSLTISNLTIAP